jgi:hypothetical protein
MTNYYQRILARHGWTEEQYRAIRRREALEALKDAWSPATEDVKAEFMAWAGLTDASEKPAAGDGGPLSNYR